MPAATATLVRYHRSASGKYSRCEATDRPCPLGGYHLTQEVVEALTYSAATIRQTPVRVHVDQPVLNLNPQSLGSIEDLTLAPVGMSSIACKVCGRYQPHAFRAHENMAICYHCGEYTSVQHFYVDLRAGEEKYLDDSVTLNSNWYHISKQADWANSVQQGGREHFEDGIMVHVGSKEAALDRLRDIRRVDMDVDDYYLHEVRLAPNTELSPNVMRDEDYWPARGSEAGTYEHFGISSAGATRYVNGFEAPGTISLITNGKRIQPVTSIRLPSD